MLFIDFVLGCCNVIERNIIMLKVVYVFQVLFDHVNMSCSVLGILYVKWGNFFENIINLQFLILLKIMRNIKRKESSKR